MKLTDFCILFAALFVCLFMGRDLRIAAVCAQQYTEISYNRQLDRIAEDAMMDIVQTQYEDGTLLLQTKKLQEQYERLIGLAFDLTDDEQRLRAAEAVTLWQLDRYPYGLSMQAQDQLIADMEKQAMEAKRKRREAQLFAIAMPYISHDAWYQSPAGEQLLTVFDPREPFRGYDRAVLSGSRILKLYVDRTRDKNLPL